MILIGAAFLMSSDRVTAGTDNSSELLSLAKEKFANLTKAEESLFRAVAQGKIADYRDKNKENNDPKNAGKWGNERLIRGKCVEWLCTDNEAMELVTHTGIQVIGVRIDEKLDLQFIKIPFPLIFCECSILSGIKLQHARIRMLSLQGTHTGLIRADGVDVEGSILLRNVKALGGVFLIGATIGGELSCKGGEFINRNGPALTCNSAKVSQNILLDDGFKAEGEVDLGGATIGGQLNCSSGEFNNPKGTALNGDTLKVIGNVSLRNGFEANGEVNLRGADIEGQLSCIRGIFINPNGMAFIGDSLKVEESILLANGFKAEGEVRLTGATIGGQLSCNNAQFINPGGNAIIADELNVAGNVFFSGGFKAEGKVHLHRTTIGGDLNCDGGQFVNPKGEAIDGYSLAVKGNVFFRNGFKAEGEVYLVGVTIGGQLACTGGQFINPDGKALNADSIKVDKHVFLTGHFKAEGNVDFVGAEIAGSFQWRKVDSPEKVTLDLRFATIGILNDEQGSWPEKGKLFLHGLVYDKIDNTAPRDAGSRIAWLRLQKDFEPQTYEQLAAVMNAAGKREVARKVLIAREDDRVQFTKMTFCERLLHKLFGFILDYGYFRWKPLLWGFLCIAMGSAFFRIGYWGGVITPHSESAYVERDTGIVVPGDGDHQLSDVYPRFNFFVYSVDTFVPLIDLHQAKYWLPNANLGHELFNIKGLVLNTGGLMRLCFWIHIAFGWILTTLLVAGLTGLVRT